MTISIQNVGRRIQVHTLEHGLVCGPEDCGCVVIEQTSIDHNPKTGERGRRVFDKSIPRSLLIAAGETVSELPESVLMLPSIAAARAAGEIVVKEDRHGEPTPRFEDSR